jgi:hypothetical protein
MSDIYGTTSLFLPLPWLTWLAGSEVRVQLYGWRDLYGLVRALHLLGLGAFYGGSLLLALRALGWAAPEPAERARIGRRIMHGGFYVTLISGLLLFLRDPIGMGLHSMFLPKLLLVGLGFALAQGLRWMPSLGALRRFSACALVAIWTLTVGMSTWNHVERPVQIGARLRATTSVPR